MPLVILKQALTLSISISGALFGFVVLSIVVTVVELALFAGHSLHPTALVLAEFFKSIFVTACMGITIAGYILITRFKGFYASMTHALVSWVVAW